MAQIDVDSVPTRLVICVDGTWMNADGLENGFTGNPTNVYRIHASVKEGLVQTNDGKWINQKKEYIEGLGYGQEFFGKVMNGAFGLGLAAQVQKVYELCCTHLHSSSDEVYFFGFSRGAYVVRAVASLLHYLKLLKATPGTTTFTQSYERSLSIYRSLVLGDLSRRAEIHKHFEHVRSTGAPTIGFVGAFDTVKAANDGNIYDIACVDSIRRFRHAMSLNEDKKKFEVERCWFPVEKSSVDGLQQSHVEAWFIGTHGDMGGANKADGLALYPLQWMLIEAHAAGLILGFTRPDFPFETIDNPLTVVFPASDDNPASVPHVFPYENGIQVNMHEFQFNHKESAYEGRYQVKINRSLHNKYLFPTLTREPFDGGNLKGYISDGSMGTIVHPSVYLIFDTHPNIYLNAQSWGFRNDLGHFRTKMLVDEGDTYWDRTQLDVGNNIKAIRILVCGNAGSGKSTLINKVFGLDLTEEIARGHGMHDIEKGFTTDDHPNIIIHDSCGFQTGDANEVEKMRAFLTKRSTCADITERLHVIWYCTLVTRKRGTETSDTLFFEAMLKIASEVPIVLVGTHMDVFKQTQEGMYFSKIRSRNLNRIEMNAELDKMDDKVVDDIQALQATIASEFGAIRGAAFHGPVFTSKDDLRTIRELESMTLSCLDNHYVRKLYVAAQICNVDQKLDVAISETVRLYKKSVYAAAIPMMFSGITASTVVSLYLCKNILSCFGYTDIDATMLNQCLYDIIWCSMDAHSVQLLSGTSFLLAAAAAETVILAPPIGLASIGVAHLAAIPASARVVLMCACDVMLTLERAFWLKDQKDKIGPDDIRTAAEEYAKKYAMVHGDVKSVVPLFGVVKSFRFSQVQLGIEAVIQKHRYQKK